MFESAQVGERPYKPADRIDGTEIRRPPDSDISPNPATVSKAVSAEAVEALSSTEFRRARAFLRQKYPLSEQGRELYKRVQATLAANDQKQVTELSSLIPSVENPRLELFQDFELTPEQSDQVFGQDLANVQVTKGCSHKCTFCAAGAAPRVEMMPFPAILKIARKKLEWDKKVETLTASWLELLRQKTGFVYEDLSTWDKNPIPSWLPMKRPDGTVGKVLGSSSMPDKVFNFGKQHYSAHPLSEIFPAEAFFFKFPAGEYDVKQCHMDAITNYYDSDIFDYCNATFLHEDGTPADFGDVFQALASAIRPIHITTAGWQKQNHIAQRAASKIIKQCKENPEILSRLRISVNKYERNARRNSHEYREDMTNVIHTFAPIDPIVLLYYDTRNPDKSFYDDVIVSLHDMIVSQYSGKKNMMSSIKATRSVSYFSGPMADEKFQEDYDAGACMPGIHIWPDGNVQRQGPSDYWRNYKIRSHILAELQKQPNMRNLQLTKGTRPQPTGLKLY